MRIKIEKLDDNVGEGDLPEVGKRFSLIKDNGGYYQTSTVQEVDEENGIFKTMNSTYRFEVVEGKIN